MIPHPHLKSLPSISQYINQYNSIETPTGHFGFRRADMPQIEGSKIDAYLNFLKQHGVAYRKVWVKVNSLKLTQSEFNKYKVLDLINQNIDKKRKIQPLLVNNDGFVLDGSHRFLALYNTRPQSDVEVIQIMMPIQQLVRLSNEFSGVAHRDHSDRKIAQ